MRWGLLGARLSIVVVYLIIAAIIVLSLLPLAAGKLEVSIPDKNGGETRVDGSQVLMTIPVDITNDGFFDIQGLTVRLRIADGADVIAEHSSVPVTVAAGRTDRLDLSIVVDLDDVDPGKLRDLVFNSTTLDLNVGVEAGYSLGLVKASISTDQEMEWEPMISNVSVDTSNLRGESNGTNVDMLVPYHFDASSFAQGKQVGVLARLSNSTAVLGTASENLIIGPSNDGQLRFVVPQQTFQWLLSHPQSLVLDADLTLMNATMHLQRIIPAGGGDMSEFSPRIGSVGKGVVASVFAAVKYLVVPVLILTALTTMFAQIEGASVIADQLDLERIRSYVLALGVPIIVLAFFRGFYPKGTRSRFAFAMAITALVCVWIWMVMMGGNLTLELEGFGLSISYVGLVLLFILAAVLGGIYYLVEMVSYRREWLASREQLAVPPASSAP